MPDGSKVVDVGGGIGWISLPVAKRFPKLKFVVQDLFVDRTEEVNPETSHPFHNDLLTQITVLGARTPRISQLGKTRRSTCAPSLSTSFPPAHNER